MGILQLCAGKGSKPMALWVGGHVDPCRTRFEARVGFPGKPGRRVFQDLPPGIGTGMVAGQ
jgi:hypothetical protein